MTPQQERVLRTLLARGPVTQASLKADSSTVSELIERQLILSTPPAGKGASARLNITAAGKQALHGEDGSQNATILQQLDTLRKQVADLHALVEAIAITVGASAVTEQPCQPALPRTLEQFESALRHACHELSTKGGHGALVPLPRVRESLISLGISREAFDDALLALEEQFRIDLKVANDPERLTDRQHGIEVPNRGLLYFVVLR
ncbi:MAG TPA: hypothetical protein PLM08_25435 [Polyangiaceae bacterium]|nr:hypothetical protein [Polyangiaceae bacterium]